jgi:hypothetical protein
VDRFHGAVRISARKIRSAQPKSISEEAVSLEEVEGAHFAEERREPADFAERRDFVEFRIVAAVVPPCSGMRHVD